MKHFFYLAATTVFFMIMSTTITNAKEYANNDGEITLTASQDEERHISRGHDVEPDKAATPRSVILQPVYAYLHGQVVSLDFTEIVSSATVTITGISTGETVYSETHSSPITLNINLNGEKKGDYLIEINTNDICMIGIFNL